MKKIIYSPVTKLVALLISLVCVFQTVNLVTDCIIEYFGDDREIYRFENSFDDSSYMSYYLNEAMNATFNGFVTYKHGNPEKKTLEELVEEKLKYVSDFSDYKVVINDTVFESRDNISETQLLNKRFNSYFYKKENGEIDFSTSENISYSYYWAEMQNEKNYKIEIYCALDDGFVEECERIWIEQRNLIYNTFTRGVSLVLVFFVLLIYLICTCGRNSEGEQKSMWIDKIPVELHLAFMVLFFGLGLGIAFIMFDEFLYSINFPKYMIETAIPVTSTLAVFLVIVSLLSLVRKIKCGIFLSTSIVYIVLKWLFKAVKCIFAFLQKVLKKLLKACLALLKHLASAFSRKTALILLLLLVVYTAAVSMLTLFTFYEDGLWLVIYAFVFVLACVFVAYRAKDFEEISRGAKQIRGGNLSYVITEPKSDDMKLLAENINQIAKGLDESVSAKLRAERLKTELITNVSHDLKTPLTSIINYTELLSKVEGLPEEAADYISIIAKKSDRLKTLTQDLFDISKVQSGNEAINFERLDASLLISQSLGEHDGEIAESGLRFCVDTPRELYIYADGRKMSRVIGNLISNILKYTMKGTRVFITACEKDGKAVMEFKNVASYPMEFDAEEIMARFVRGDESRTQEGNGLGLAIAKGYTEACGGKIDVVIDGDLFKAVIKFDLME